MDAIFNRDIKGLIDEFPEVGTILETFQVGCTTCQVGTCLLKDHIKREDEILYPWLDKQLSMQQIGQMFAQFSEVDNQFQTKAKECEQFIETLEEVFRLKAES